MAPRAAAFRLDEAPAEPASASSSLPPKPRVVATRAWAAGCRGCVGFALAALASDPGERASRPALRPVSPLPPPRAGPSKAEAVFVTFLFREREAWTGTFEVPGKWIELAPKTFEFALCEPHRRAALPPEPSNTGSSGTSSYVELTGFARPGYLLARCSSVLPAGEDGCVTVPRLGRPPPRSRAGCSDPREPSLLRLEWSH